MPQIKNAPLELNNLLEEVYSKCMKKHNNEAMCSASAYTAAKDVGWHKDKKNGTWKRKK